LASVARVGQPATSADRHDVVAGRRSGQSLIAILYLVAGCCGILPLVWLTPPFQVPDEQQHFFRAFQISEGQLRGIVRDGAAGGMLPSSLAALEDRFLGTRALHVARPVEPSPLRETFGAWNIDLDPSRREFVVFTGAAFYSPLAYAPQVAGIVLARELGFGPFGLLYAARLFNAVAAILLMAAAIRLLPVGKIAFAVLALMPMALFEFASASPDAGVIGSASLFCALAWRARFAGCWRLGDWLLCCLAGIAFCSLKPVYAPLLVATLPGQWRDRNDSRAVVALLAMVAVVMVGTLGWLSYASASLVPAVPGTSVAGQLDAIFADPRAFLATMGTTLDAYGQVWIWGTIGLLGWLTIALPPIMYLLPPLCLLISPMIGTGTILSMKRYEIFCNFVILIAIVILIMLALYLYFTPVGADRIEGVQGRYFLPLVGLVAMTWASLWPKPALPRPAVGGVLFLCVMVETAFTLYIVAAAYRVF
jgi:hypothetical protein